MDENFKKQLEECGVDVDVALNRFMGREAIFMKFIMKFTEDQNCMQIRGSLENRDVRMAFEQAHSLKGVAGNLGVTSVYTLAAEISDLLRDKQADEVDFDQAMEVVDKLEESYTKVCCVVKEHGQ